MEFPSNATVLGLPLVYIATGRAVDGAYRRGVATGWIAISDVAIGVLLACGGIALGGISLGGASFEIFSIGGLALGLAAIGGLGVGIVAAAGAAFGRHVMRALSPEWASRPPLWRAPFRWSDALLIIVIVGVLLGVARRPSEPEKVSASLNRSRTA